VGLRHPSECRTRVRSPASGYRAPRSRLLAEPRSTGPPRSRCSRSAIESGSVLSWAYASLQSLTRTGPSHASPRSTAPLRFLPSQRSRYRESTGPGLPRPDVPPPGFCTLLTVCSSRPLRAYFIPVALSGFSPFEAFPSGDRSRLVGGRPTRMPLAEARLPGLVPPGRFRCRRAAVRPHASAQASLGFLPFRG